MILVTGAAGFIGLHVALALLARGEKVLGVDNLNPYYDPALKKARLALLQEHTHFSFVEADIADAEAMMALAAQPITHIIHLAAQAGVRYSLEAPLLYAHSNVTGHLTMLELARQLPNLKHFVYASSSSVYGANASLPFATTQRTDHPISLYAATKKAGEVMTQSYSHLYGIAATGLRYFTVYGPWGRPDMALFSFTQKILAGEPITLFNHGKMQRNFTYIDDVVAGTLAALDHPPQNGMPATQTAVTTTAPHRIYNIGNNQTIDLLVFVQAIEKALGKKANIRFADAQAGDIKDTHADITTTVAELGFAPKTHIEAGVAAFVAWYGRHKESTVK
jgi:UDP-glucuronate 4-epimerase